MNLQQIQLLASQLEALSQDQFSDYAFTLQPAGSVEVCKMRWYQRLIRYFCPDRYSVLQHIPKITELALQAFRQDTTAINYKNFADNIEKVLFSDITQQRLRIEQSKTLKLTANTALEHLAALRDEVDVTPQDKRVDDVVISLKRLLKNPIDTPHTFFSFWYSLTDAEQAELLLHKKIKPLATKLGAELFQVLTGNVPFSRAVEIKPSELIQKSDPVHVPNSKLRHWQSKVPNYKAVCNSLDRRPLSCVVINGTTLSNTLTKLVSHKVPVVCEKLLSAAKGRRVTFEDTLLPMVGEMAAMMAIELPNPISTSQFLFYLYNAVRPEMKLYAHGENEPTIDHEFTVQKLEATYRTTRRYTVIKVNSPTGEQVELAKLEFVSEMHKNFADPTSSWTGTLSSKKN